MIVKDQRISSSHNPIQTVHYAKTHSSVVQAEDPLLSRNTLNTNLMHVTAIQADPEVAFRKLPSAEFIMFY